MITRPILLLATLLTSGMVHAKTSTPVLTDPATGKPLAKTAYFMIVKGEKPQTRLQYTNTRGKTRPASSKPSILVQAEGNGKNVFLADLKTTATTSDIAIQAGTPYIIYNPTSNQGLCGTSDAAGHTHAYFMDDTQSWYKNSYVFAMQTPQPCAQVRSIVAPLMGNNSEQFAQAYDEAKRVLKWSEKIEKAFLYAHISRIISDKNTNIDQTAAKNIIERGIQVAQADKDASQLNSISYDLAFKRKNYTRGLPLLTEALMIQPHDCNTINSKGYLLMRTGKFTDALTYFQKADEICTAELKKSPKSGYDDAIAVNYAHLAENHSSLGDPILANDFFDRALRMKSIAAYDEIMEVAENLQKQNVLNPSNLDLLDAYRQYMQAQ